MLEYQSVRTEPNYNFNSSIRWILYATYLRNHKSLNYWFLRSWILGCIRSNPNRTRHRNRGILVSHESTQPQLEGVEATASTSCGFHGGNPPIASGSALSCVTCANPVHDRPPSQASLRSAPRPLRCHGSSSGRRVTALCPFLLLPLLSPPLGPRLPPAGPLAAPR